MTVGWPAAFGLPGRQDVGFVDRMYEEAWELDRRVSSNTAKAGPLDELRIGFASGEERTAHRALPRRRLVPVQHQDGDAGMPMPRARFGARPMTASKRSFRSSPLANLPFR